MKPTSILVIVWSLIVFGYTFLHHDRLYNIYTLTIFCSWVFIVFMVIYWNEIQNVHWPWQRLDNNGGVSKL